MSAPHAHRKVISQHFLRRRARARAELLELRQAELERARARAELLELRQAELERARARAELLELRQAELGYRFEVEQAARGPFRWRVVRYGTAPIAHHPV